MKLRILVLAAAGLLAACGAAFGDEGTRVAVADMEKVFTNHPTTVAVEAKLKDGLTALEAEMQEMIAEGRAIDEEAKTLRADMGNALLSEEARREKKLAYEEKMAESRDFQAKVKRTYEFRMKQLQDDVIRQKEEIVANLMSEVGAFAERSGYDLILVSNREVELKAAAASIRDQYPVQVTARFQDLAEADAADRLFAWCMEEQELLPDIVINDAGMFFFKELRPEDLDSVQTMIHLHVVTVTRICLLFGNAMKQRGSGYLLNLSSMAARTELAS